MTDDLAKLLGHIIIPMVTPFKRENEDIDYPAASNLIETPDRQSLLTALY